MNYKKKYESALKKAKSAIENCGYNQGRIAMIESIFPELKKSGDEKIRTGIYNYIKATLEDYEPEKEKWLAWLKKLEVFAKYGDGMYYLHNNDFTYFGGNQTSDIEQEVKSTFHSVSSEPKESNDEKIKKAIKYGLDHVFTNNTTVYETTKEQCLSWLETHKYTEEDLEKAYKCADKVQYMSGYNDARNEIIEAEKHL